MLLPMRVVAVVVALSAVAATAVASPGGELLGEYVREIGRREDRPMRTPLGTVAVGYHGDVAAMAEVKVGYGVGTFVDTLFPDAELWRFSVAGRVAQGREDSLAVSALGGWGAVGLVGWTIEAGLDARVDPGDRDIGPIVAGALRMGHLGLHLNGWVHVVGETEVGFSAAVGWSFADVGER